MYKCFNEQKFYDYISYNATIVSVVLQTTELQLLCIMQYLCNNTFKNDNVRIILYNS